MLRMSYVKNKKIELHLVLFWWNTLSVSSWITRTDPHFQVVVAWRRSESKSWTKEDRESVENREKREPRMSLWCWCAAQSKLSRPTSSAIDFIYFFENFPSSFRITFADSVLDIKTCVSPNNLVLKHFPYLTHTHGYSNNFTSVTIYSGQNMNIRKLREWDICYRILRAWTNS